MQESGMQCTQHLNFKQVSVKDRLVLKNDIDLKLLYDKFNYMTFYL